MVSQICVDTIYAVHCATQLYVIIVSMKSNNGPLINYVDKIGGSQLSIIQHKLK